MNSMGKHRQISSGGVPVGSASPRAQPAILYYRGFRIRTLHDRPRTPEEHVSFWPLTESAYDPRCRNRSAAFLNCGTLADFSATVGCLSPSGSMAISRESDCPFKRYRTGFPTRRSATPPPHPSNASRSLRWRSALLDSTLRPAPAAHSKHTPGSSSPSCPLHCSPGKDRPSSAEYVVTTPLSSTSTPPGKTSQSNRLDSASRRSFVTSLPASGAFKPPAPHIADRSPAASAQQVCAPAPPRDPTPPRAPSARAKRTPGSSSHCFRSIRNPGRDMRTSGECVEGLAYS